MQWHVIQVYTGKEKTVKTLIEKISAKMQIGNIERVVASINYVGVHATKKIIAEPIIKSYIFIRCDMTADVKNLLYKIPFVSRIIGVIADDEMEEMIPRIVTQTVELKDPPCSGTVAALKKKYKEIVEKVSRGKLVIRLPRILLLKIIRSLKHPDLINLPDNRVFKALLEFSQ